MEKTDLLLARRRELGWRVLLQTPQSFSTSQARHERRELGRVISLISAASAEA